MLVPNSLYLSNQTLIWAQISNKPLFSWRSSHSRARRIEPSAPPFLPVLLDHVPASWKPIRTAWRATPLHRPADPTMAACISSAMYF